MERENSNSMTVSWDEVKDAANRAFHVWVEQPELIWAGKAWAMLHDAKLTTYANELERYQVLFRLLILGGIYSDFCDAAWEERSEPDYGYWAEPLDLDPFLLGQLYAKQPNSDPEEDQNDALDKLVENEREAVVAALVAAFGGASALYEALWKSKDAEDVDPEEDDSFEAAANQLSAYN
jgi:hypothetical protein